MTNTEKKSRVGILKDSFLEQMKGLSYSDAESILQYLKEDIKYSAFIK